VCSPSMVGTLISDPIAACVIEIVAFPLEESVLFDVKDHVEIARRSAELADLASASEADTRTVFDSGGNFRVDGALAQNAALAAAFRARIGDDVAATLASRAGARDAEETLLIANLAASVAGAAGRGPLAGSGAGATTLFAGFVTADGHFRFRAEKSLFEFESQIFA